MRMSMSKYSLRSKWQTTVLQFHNHSNCWLEAQPMPFLLKCFSIHFVWTSSLGVPREHEGCCMVQCEGPETVVGLVLTCNLLWQQTAAVLIKAFLRKYSDWAHGRNPTFTRSPSVPLQKEREEKWSKGGGRAEMGGSTKLPFNHEGQGPICTVSPSKQKQTHVKWQCCKMAIISGFRLWLSTSNYLISVYQTTYTYFTKSCCATLQLHQVYV